MARRLVSSYTVLRRAVGYSFVTVPARSGTENEGAQRYTFCDGMTWMDVEVELLNLEPGDRIELSYEDSSAKTIRATVRRLLSPRGEAMGDEVEQWWD